MKLEYSFQNGNISLMNNKICTVHVGDEKGWKLAVKLINIELRVL